MLNLFHSSKGFVSSFFLSYWLFEFTCGVLTVWTIWDWPTVLNSSILFILLFNVLSIWLSHFFDKFQTRRFVWISLVYNRWNSLKDEGMFRGVRFNTNVNIYITQSFFSRFSIFIPSDIWFIYCSSFWIVLFQVGASLSCFLFMLVLLFVGSQDSVYLRNMYFWNVYFQLHFLYLVVNFNQLCELFNLITYLIYKRKWNPISFISVFFQINFSFADLILNVLFLSHT